jgi:DNA-binding beta-propeller fold protein YncE
MKKKLDNDCLLMKRKKSFSIALCLLLVVAGWVLSGSSQAASGGWKWRFNLESAETKTPFLMPVSLFIEDESSRFYVVEAGANRLHSFQFDGTYLSTFGPEGTLQLPFAMVKEKHSGYLWIVEKGRNSLTKVDMKAKILRPETLMYKGAVVYPDRLSLHDDKLYVLNKLTGDVIAYNFALEPLVVYNCPGEGFIDFVVKNSELLALDARSRTLSRFSLDGKLEEQIVLGGKLSFPVAVEIGPSGFIYILDKHEGSIVVFDTSGKFKYSFLKKGHAVNNLYQPENIFFDPLGRLCVVDTGNGRIAVFSR